MMKRGRTFALVAATAMVALTALPAESSHPWFAGLSSWAPANGYDAPIFRQFAFVEGKVTQYHVLTPEAFLTDQHQTNIYQFPMCQTLRPVLEKHVHAPGDGGFQGDHDAPTRRIVDVVLSTGCGAQPKSEAEVLALAIDTVARPLWVNAPVIPEQLEDLTDEQLYNGPPYRPRVAVWEEGVERQMITYETSWHPSWLGANFPAQDADVFIISYGSLYRHDWSILNFAAGTPHDPDTFQAYSPIWKANCIVDPINQKCMISVNLEVPGYFQCTSFAECSSMVNENCKDNKLAEGMDEEEAEAECRVKIIPANTFTHINCPMVAVDLDGDNYISAWEELVFPDLWVDGPVIA